MKPLHHYLRRFCSEQVQILLQRMEDHYAEEFAGHDSKWDVYVSSGGGAFDRYTAIERFCVVCTRDAQEKIYKRQQMLDGILVRTMSPAKTKYAFSLEQEQEREERAGQKKMLISPSQLAVMRKVVAQGESHTSASPYRAQQDDQIAAAQYAQYQQRQQHLQDQLRNWLKP